MHPRMPTAVKSGYNDKDSNNQEMTSIMELYIDGTSGTKQHFRLYGPAGK